jgi:hypothetical protein
MAVLESLLAGVDLAMTIERNSEHTTADQLKVGDFIDFTPAAWDVERHRATVLEIEPAVFGKHLHIKLGYVSDVTHTETTQWVSYLPDKIVWIWS